MDDNLDWAERLIQCIQKRPVLYDRLTKDYSDRIVNKHEWSEVFKEMIDNWDELSIKDKKLQGNEIKQRWRNLRTCFRRELNKQRYKTSGQVSDKRRKYIYYDNLLFLLPTIEDLDTPVSSINSPEVGLEVEGNEDGSDEYISEKTQSSTEMWIKQDTSYDEPETSRKTPLPVEMWFQKDTTSYEVPEVPGKTDRSMEMWHETDAMSCKESQTPGNRLQLRDAEEIDEDKSFLISLVPSFKRMTEDEKLEAKMGFLQVLKRIRNRNNLC